jgi:hypothetical protein
VQEIEKMPTWIPPIDGYAFGEPLDFLKGRKNGDSLVGCHERQNHQHYHASGNLRPHVEFGKFKHWDASQNLSIIDESNPAGMSSVVGLSDLPGIPNQQSKPTEVRRTNKFDGTLNVKGFKLDTIKNISGRVLDGIIPVEAFEYGGWPKVPEDGKFPHEVPDRLWRTLVADRGPDGTNAPPWYRRACLECLTHVGSNGDLNTNKFKDFEDTPSAMKQFLKRVRDVVWNRKFFLTAGKRYGKLYGIGPPKASNNDIICILFGCSVPVVLREVGNDKYHFIGECYVHEIMDGESLHVRMPEYPYRNINGFTII